MQRPLWRAVTLSTAVAAILALALPVQAKVDGTAFISGPGIGNGGSGSGSGDSGSGGPGSGSSESGTGGGTIRMNGSDGGGFYPTMSGLIDPANSVTQRPTGELGPRYEVRYVIRQPQQQPPILQHLYPYAQDGPILYTPPGQEWIMSESGEARGGWFRPAPELIYELRGRGLPETAPVDAPDGARPLPAAPSPPTPLVWALALLAGVLVIGALAGRRRAAARA